MKKKKKHLTGRLKITVSEEQTNKYMRFFCFVFLEENELNCSHPNYEILIYRMAV